MAHGGLYAGVLMERMTKQEMDRRVLAVQVSDCRHRGKDIGNRWSAGCAARRRKAMVFQCTIHGKACERLRVTIEGTRRPDRSVAICLGCPEYKRAN